MCVCDSIRMSWLPSVLQAVRLVSVVSENSYYFCTVVLPCVCMSVCVRVCVHVCVCDSIRMSWHPSVLQAVMLVLSCQRGQLLMLLLLFYFN